MKRKFNIQLFTEDGGTVVGSDIVYLLRVKKDAATENGVILAFTTQNNRSLSSGVGTTQTKDGPVATPGTVEETLSVTSYLKKGDAMVSKLEEALKDGDVMEIWEADLSGCRFDALPDTCLTIFRSAGDNAEDDDDHSIG